VQQQTGRLLRQRQQEQPHFIIIVMQSQHSWMILQHWGSPLVQAKHTPFFIISVLHMPIVMLKQAIIIPLFIRQQLIIEPAIMSQRFCNMPVARASSLWHIIFMPPSHFSTLIVQRGTIIMFMAGVAIVVEGFAIIGLPMFILSTAIIVFMYCFLSLVGSRSRRLRAETAGS
jgi:hypothetical protein